MSSLSNPNAYSGIVKNSDSGGSGFPTEITKPSDGQLLQYDGESEKWVNVDSFVRVINETHEKRQATQDDVTNYVYDSDGNNLVVGDLYDVFTYDIKAEEFTHNNVYSILEEGVNRIDAQNLIICFYVSYDGETYEVELFRYSSGEINKASLIYTSNNIYLKLFYPVGG